jgi:signal transduction histidine kinase
MTEARNSRSRLLDKKKTVIILQWLVVIMSSYQLLFSKGGVSEDPLAHGLVMILLISALVSYRLPEAFFHHQFFDTMLLTFDTLLISTAMYINRDTTWDLFLFYFFILFIAAIGENMVRIVLGSVVLSLVYFGLLVQQGKDLSQTVPDLLVRVSFLFGASVLYGYLSENAKKERRRAETAEENERLKMDLVSTLAHDIKTPLGIIMGHAGMIEDKLTRRNEGREYLEPLQRIQEGGQRIVNLVTGFLTATKVESGKSEMGYMSVSVNSLLKDAIRQQQIDVEKKRLILELKLDDKLPEALGDESQLDRVFWNLIGNAVKFTPTGGKITVSSGADNGYVRVAIRDSGIGISQAELPLLFSQFRRLKGSEKIDGTGLGLFIVKTIIEAHKGTVQVESVEGQGSTFTVRVPTSS